MKEIGLHQLIHNRSFLQNAIEDVIFTTDRVTKLNIINNYSDDIYFLNNFINFDLIWNLGIGFGLLTLDSSFAYNIITFFIGGVILTLIYIATTSDILDRFNFSIIIGGALGNFYDRLIYQAVPDFIDLHYKSFHWFTFNVADIFISIAILAFIINGFFAKTDK